MPITVEFPLKTPIQDGYPVSIQEFKDALLKARMDKRHTQKEAAKQIGVDVCTIRLWEHGKTNPTPQNWIALKRYVPEDHFKGTFSIIEAKPFTLKNVAQICGISHWTLIDWIQLKRIPKPSKDPVTRSFIFSESELQQVKTIAQDRVCFKKKR